MILDVLIMTWRHPSQRGNLSPLGLHFAVAYILLLYIIYCHPSLFELLNFCRDSILTKMSIKLLRMFIILSDSTDSFTS